MRRAKPENKSWHKKKKTAALTLIVRNVDGTLGDEG